MKVVEIFVASNCNDGTILPLQNEDFDLLLKYRKELTSHLGEQYLTHGFWKITIKSYFFGLIKFFELELLEMEL